MKPWLTSLTSLLLLALSLAPLTAQELTTGTITGKVTDLAGRPIAGAIVIVVSESGTRTATTDANGGDLAPVLPPLPDPPRAPAPRPGSPPLHGERYGPPRPL